MLQTSYQPYLINYNMMFCILDSKILSLLDSTTNFTFKMGGGGIALGISYKLKGFSPKYYK